MEDKLFKISIFKKIGFGIYNFLERLTYIIKGRWMKMIKRLSQLMNTNEVCIIKMDDEKPRYKIYTNDARSTLFMYFIPILGNIIALISFILSLTRNVYVDNKKEYNILFSTIKK